jgi:hypothetical protein
MAVRAASDVAELPALQVREVDADRAWAPWTLSASAPRISHWCKSKCGTDPARWRPKASSPSQRRLIAGNWFTDGGRRQRDPDVKEL